MIQGMKVVSAALIVQGSAIRMSPAKESATKQSLVAKIGSIFKKGEKPTDSGYKMTLNRSPSDICREYAIESSASDQDQEIELQQEVLYSGSDVDVYQYDYGVEKKEPLWGKMDDGNFYRMVGFNVDGVYQQQQFGNKIGHIREAGFYLKNLNERAQSTGLKNGDKLLKLTAVFGFGKRVEIWKSPEKDVFTVKDTERLMNAIAWWKGYTSQVEPLTSKPSNLDKPLDLLEFEVEHSSCVWEHNENDILVPVQEEVPEIDYTKHADYLQIGQC